MISAGGGCVKSTHVLINRLGLHYMWKWCWYIGVVIGGSRPLSD